MAKFILIDQSITGLGGHNFEYAVRVLEAARTAGFDPYLATNREFRETKDLPCPVHPVYRYGFFSEPAPGLMTRMVGSLGRAWTAARGRMTYSQAGLLWHAPKPLARTAAWSGGHPWGPVAGQRLLGLGLWGLQVLLLAWQALFSWAPFNRYLGGSYVKGIGAAAAALARGIIYRWTPEGAKALAQFTFKKARARAFAADTGSFLLRLAPGPDDHVFIPTLGEIELAGMADAFEARASALQGTWHLLFRRNIFEGRDPDYSHQLESTRMLRNSLLHFRRKAGAARVRFYTDTEPLTRQYNRLGIFPFRTAPIPTVPPLDTVPAAEPEPQAMRVIYAGDARTEKGYQCLPRLVQDLWAGYVASGKARFEFQSNFNIPDGEPKARVARAQLECYPQDKVALLKKPMTPREYGDFIRRGQVAVVPYEPSNYYARSSGVFVECLVLGMPVVVPAGTWMAAELGRSILSYHDAIRRKVRHIGTLPLSDIRWWAQHPDQPTELKEGRLSLQAYQTCVLELPPGATHIIFRGRQAGEAPGVYTEITATEVDSETRVLGQKRYVLGGGGAQPFSCMLRTSARAVRVMLNVKPAFSETSLALEEFQASFLAPAQELPLSAVGMIYTTADELSACVGEIVDHRAHYLFSARAFSEGWAAYHNPATLVETLISPA